MSDKSWEPRMYECLKVLNNFCFHVYAQNLLSHFLTLTLSHSHSFSLSHSFNLSFNHSRHAEQVLFSSVCSKVAVYSRKLQCFLVPCSRGLSISVRIPSTKKECPPTGNNRPFFSRSLSLADFPLSRPTARFTFHRGYIV